jgi:multidrug efflux pump subunit AcrA (membrane-fusion protein)
MQLDPLRVTFSVPSGQAQKMHPGDTFELSLPESSERAIAKVEFVSPVTEAESGTVRVKLLIENHDNRYRCGVRCSIDLGAKVAQR